MEEHNMKLCRNVPCLFGKIKYCRLPLFDIGKIEQNLPQFKEYLMNKLNLELSHFFIKPPQPNSVLGRNIETIRFLNGFFKNSELKNVKIIDKIEMGFGENGYYYDIRLLATECRIQEFLEQIGAVLKSLEEFEKKIEHDLTEFYFVQKDPNNIKEILSISNFDITVEIDRGDKFPILPPNFTENIKTLEEESEPIIKGQNNKVQPAVRFQLYSEKMFTDPVTYGRAEKYLELDRFFEMQQSLDDANKWRFVARGIPVYALMNFMKLFQN